jgi:hypothetical protein
MPSQFLAGISGKLVERWAATLFTPAFVFWFGGLAAFYDHDRKNSLTLQLVQTIPRTPSDWHFSDRPRHNPRH